MIGPRKLQIGGVRKLTSVGKACEKYIYSFPNYKMRIEDSATDFDIRSVAIFSDRKHAVPVLMLHGWPGTYCFNSMSDMLISCRKFPRISPILGILMIKYTTVTLPYHIIVPSLPGYASSSLPPLDQDFRFEDVARILNKVMIQLGFENGICCLR